MDPAGEKKEEGPGGFPNFGHPGVDQQMNQLGSMGPAGGVILCCVFCCLCVLLVFVIAYVIWAFFTIFDSYPAFYSGCAGESNIWLFCMAYFVILPIVGCCLSCLVATLTMINQGDNAKFLNFIPACLSFILAGWGVFIWATMSGDCHHFYEATYPNLLLLFKISVIIACVGFLILCCVLCIMGTVLVAGLSQMNSGTGAGYNDIPSADEAKTEEAKSKQTEDYV